MEEKTKLFWQIYDTYLQSGDVRLRADLSRLLAQIEKKERVKQLLRPEKEWNKILGWQVLRNQMFIFLNNNHKYLMEGEIIVWLPHWDRDVLVTRSPREEFVSGSFLKPGYNMTWEDKGERSDYEWDQLILQYGIADERGLYLPLYESTTIEKLCDNFCIEHKKSIHEYLQKEVF